MRPPCTTPLPGTVYYTLPPFLNFAVRRCILFISLHGTRMSHRGHPGWGRLTSSSITMVSQTCRCQKFTRMAACVTARPLNPSTGQGLGPAFAGNFIRNILGSLPPSPSPSSSFCTTPLSTRRAGFGDVHPENALLDTSCTTNIGFVPVASPDNSAPLP